MSNNEKNREMKLYYRIVGSRQNKWTGAMDKAQNIMLKKIVKVFIYRYIYTYTYLCTHRYVYIVYVRETDPVLIRYVSV